MRAPLAAVLLVLSLVGCRKDRQTMLLVTVRASGSPQGIITLEVTLTSTGPAGGSEPQSYSRSDRQPIQFPTTLGAILPAHAAGDITIDIRAADSAGITVATGHEGPINVPAGVRSTAFVTLECGGSACVTDGGTGGTPDGGVTPGQPRCGNGRVDPMETCDTAIAAGDPGACPPADCSDGVPCTKDTVIGSACTARCEHPIIRLDKIPGDGCCPEMATHADDPDCSSTCGDGLVSPGETCDIAIAPGMAGACPTDKSECQTGDPCSVDELASKGTCSAICIHDPITIRSNQTADKCCPLGATKLGDTDCPIVCGDGVLDEMAGEKCDVGIPFPAPGSCPTSCNDGQLKTIDFLVGSGCTAQCVAFDIKTDVSGDGYCREGATRAIDTDCAPACGNGRLEPGEACDKAATGFGACPTACPKSEVDCLTNALVGKPDDCSARCVFVPVTSCGLEKDRCCPLGCKPKPEDGGVDPDSDADCSPTCGSGTKEGTLGEKCDIGTRPGIPGSCPTACTSSEACTEARLVSAGTCTAACVLLPITAPRAGDGCCPGGADFTNDPDCPPRCGNGIVESPAEPCDHAAAGSCPTQCPPAGSCAVVELRGSAETCSAECVTEPITGCASADSCCPPGCTAATDSDCQVICGDGVISASETCDRRITSGKPGACPATCDDQDACTVDVAMGSVETCTRTCAHARITACQARDGCCPTGCTPENDTDCAPSCRDGRVGMGETCDPPASCPTTCPDDGDACTRDQLTGDPAQCNSACRHTPITACSGTIADACCPTGCTTATDSDC
jgi:hypothetical protein